MSTQTTTREALTIAQQVASGQVTIEWRNIAALGDVLYALTRGARTEAKRQAYAVIAGHVDLMFMVETPEARQGLCHPYPAA